MTTINDRVWNKLFPQGADHDFALALDDLALLAHGLDRRSDFHIV